MKRLWLAAALLGLLLSLPACGGKTAKEIALDLDTIGDTWKGEEVVLEEAPTQSPEVRPSEPSVQQPEVEGPPTAQQPAEEMNSGELEPAEPPAQSPESQLPAPSVQQPENEEKPASTEEPGAISSGDVEAAQQAALKYYSGTVFEINSLEKIELKKGWKGEIMFQVSCSIGGVPEVPRAIALERRDGVWTVTNEGY